MSLSGLPDPPPRTEEGERLRTLLREEREHRHGKLLTNIDYSAIEIRIAAQLAQEIKMKPDLGRAIRIVRAARGYTLEQVHDLCGLDPTTINAYEMGTRNPSMESLYQVAKALDVRPWVLLFLADGKPDGSEALSMRALYIAMEEVLKPTTKTILDRQTGKLRPEDPPSRFGRDSE